MNMDNPENDPRSSPPEGMTKNADGSNSWRVTDGQVRYGVYTSQDIVLIKL